MQQEQFAQLLAQLTAAAEAGDAQGFAACFTEDAVYDDYIYGPHAGRAAIAQMLGGLFLRDATDYRWQMFDPVCNGAIGYAWSLSSFTSTIPEFAGRRVVIDGMSRFTLADGRIAHYRESVNGGVAMSQLGVAPERMAKVCARWARTLADSREVRAFVEPRG
jgi:ketosteroid isomerase-like protein